MPPPLPLPRGVGFDVCALTPDIQELYVLQSHLDHVGIPPEGCTVYTAKNLMPHINKIYSKLNVNVDVKATNLEYIGHVYLGSDRRGTFFKSADSYAAVLEDWGVILIDECEDPASVFARFRRKYPDFTIVIMRVPFIHSAFSYLNNPWKLWPHWLADNKYTTQYAPNVMPKVLTSALEMSVGRKY